MKVGRCKKESLIAIGREEVTTDGADFIQKLWDEANSHFEEIQNLAQRDEDGNISRIWGAMPDFPHSS